MRESPIAGGLNGIWIRGSPSVEENALKLLTFYDYQIDLAKLHILHPMVMNIPENRAAMVTLGR